jgi:hypothetical protein
MTRKIKQIPPPESKEDPEKNFPQYAIRIGKIPGTKAEFQGIASARFCSWLPKKTRIMCGAVSPWYMFAALSSWLYEEAAREEQEERIHAGKLKGVDL